MVPLAAAIQATNLQLFLVFLLVQLTFIVAYKALDSKNQKILPWLLLFVLCLVYVWDTDYYSYLEDFKEGFASLKEKEYIYYLLYLLAKPYYLMWRTMVWGSAVLFALATSRRLGIKFNTIIYVLIFFYLPLFIYGRVILAMTIYFYGFSFLIKPIRGGRFISFFVGFAIASLSFFTHRSFLPLVILFPFFALPPRKIYYPLIIVSIPLIVYLMRAVFSAYTMESISMGEAFESFQYTAERISSGRYDSVRNVRATILYWARNISLYIPVIYILLGYLKNKIIIEKRFLPLLMASFLLVVLSLSLLFGVENLDMSVISKRYLFMAGIPECLLLAKLYQDKSISKRTVNWLILLGFISTEAALFVPYLIHGYHLV